MAGSRFVPDRGLNVRMVTVLGLITVVYAAAIAALIVVLGRAWPIGVAAVLVFLVVHLMTSDKVAMAAMGAHEVTPEQEPQLHAVVDRLCALADMPKPKVAMSNSRVPNSCATGRTRNRVVLCVTRGLTSELEPEELEAVVAHELSHVAHSDAMVMTVASFLGVLAGLTARFGSRVLYFGGRARNAWHIMAAALAILLLAALTWLLSTMLIRALSRYREYAADRSAAELTGNPSAVANALLKVSQSTTRIPRSDLRKAAALNAFYFCPVHHGRRGHDGGVFSTHPSVERRLARLEALSARMARR